MVKIQRLPGGSIIKFGRKLTKAEKKRAKKTRTAKKVADRGSVG